MPGPRPGQPRCVNESTRPANSRQLQPPHMVLRLSLVGVPSPLVPHQLDAMLSRKDIDPHVAREFPTRAFGVEPPAARRRKYQTNGPGIAAYRLNRARVNSREPT